MLDSYLKEKQKKQYAYTNTVPIAKPSSIFKISSKFISIGIRDPLFETIWTKNQAMSKEKDKSKM